MTQASPGEASKVPEKTPQGVTEPTTDVAALVDGLLRPEAYPWRPTTVELVETHVSWVFLSGERVVKVKKPVDYGFVDHAALASRRRSCEDEVRLNPEMGPRRLFHFPADLPNPRRPTLAGSPRALPGRQPLRCLCHLRDLCHARERSGSNRRPRRGRPFPLSSFAGAGPRRRPGRGA